MAAAGVNMQAILPTASCSKAAQPICALRAPASSSSNVRVTFSSSIGGQKLKSVQQTGRAQRASALQVSAVKDGAVLNRKLRVAVIGGGPSGACTAETLASGGCETYLIERKLDNCKVRRPIFPIYPVLGFTQLLSFLLSAVYKLSSCTEVNFYGVACSNV